MLRFILADLGRMKAGSLVVVLLIAVAVALGLGVSLSERALRLGSARASDKFDLVIGAPGSETQLVLSTVFLQPAALPLVPGEVLGALTADPGVAWVAPVGFGDFYQGWPVIGTSTVLVAETAPGFAEGRIFAAEGEAVVGAMVDLPLDAQLTPTHGEIARGGHSHDEVQYRVVGRLQPTGTPWDRAIMVPIQAVWHLHGMEAGHDHEASGQGHEDEHEHGATTGQAADGEGHDHAHEEGHDRDHSDHAGFQAGSPLDEDWAEAGLPGVPALLVKPASIADAYKLRQAYRQHEGTVAVFPAEVLTSLYGTLGDARQVLAAVAAGTQGLVAAALLLVTMAHVGQRRRQIGALRALGAPRGAIFTLVWAELFALIAAGVVLGILGGWLAARYLAQLIAQRQGFPLPVEFTAGDFTGLALLLGLGAVMAALPAWIAYRQSPVASLRQ